MKGSPLSWRSWNGKRRVVKASVEKEEQMVNSEGSLGRALSARAAKSVIASSEEAIKGPRPVSIAIMPNIGGKR